MGGIDDTENSWPPTLLLLGFVDERTSGQRTAEGLAFIDRGADWYIDWLGRQPEFSRQASLELEGHLRAQGREVTADKLAIFRTSLELSGRPLWRQLLGGLHRFTVGYGYRPELAIWRIVAFSLIGARVAHRLPPGFRRENHIASCLLFSFDKLVPLVKIRVAHANVDIARMPTLAYRYFVFHSLAGFVLAGYLATALAGITAT